MTVSSSITTHAEMSGLGVQGKVSLVQLQPASSDLQISKTVLATNTALVSLKSGDTSTISKILAGGVAYVPTSAPAIVLQ
ncbi:hypothetical protein ES703_56825 [subsurface metagenome]